jgi:hypothetical protein
MINETAINQCPRFQKTVRSSLFPSRCKVTRHLDTLHHPLQWEVSIFRKYNRRSGCSRPMALLGNYLTLFCVDEI